MIPRIPEINQAVLYHIIDFLRKLLDPATVDKTKMGADNLAIVFAPNMLRSPTEAQTPNGLLTEQQISKEFVIHLLDHLPPK